MSEKLAKKIFNRFLQSTIEMGWFAKGKLYFRNKQNVRLYAKDLTEEEVLQIKPFMKRWHQETIQNYDSAKIVIRTGWEEKSVFLTDKEQEVISNFYTANCITTTPLQSAIQKLLAGVLEGVETNRFRQAQFFQTQMKKIEGEQE